MFYYEHNICILLAVFGFVYLKGLSCGPSRSVAGASWRVVVFRELAFSFNCFTYENGLVATAM